ncbi:MAG: hypothetical protein WD595_05755 [Waddliaceae bacterium]
MIQWIKGILSELISLPIFMLLYFYNLEKRNPSPDNLKGTAPLVIGAHGYIHNSSSWFFAKRWFNKRRVPFVALTKKKAGGSIDLYKDQIVSLSERYLSYIRKNGLILLGHSMGGLAVSKGAIALLHAYPDLAGKMTVATLGSPLEGTYTAYIGFGQCAKEMYPHSPFTQNLLEQMTLHEKMLHFHHFGNKTDLLVIPYASSIRSLPIRDPRVTLKEGIGHIALLYSKEIFSKILLMTNDDNRMSY